MPTNLYGPGDNYHPEYSHVVAALIRRFHEAKVAGLKDVVVWGTGTPRREFLYVDDMADACVHLMKTYSSSELVNIGTGEDITIAEFARVVARTVGYTGTHQLRSLAARRHAAQTARRQPARQTRLARPHLARGRHAAGLSGVSRRVEAGGGVVKPPVVIASEAKQSSFARKDASFIARRLRGARLPSSAAIAEISGFMK